MQQARMLRPQGPPAYVSGWVVEKRPAMVVEFLAWLGSPGLCYSLVSLRFACNSQERTSYYNAGSPCRGSTARGGDKARPPTKPAAIRIHAVQRMRSHCQIDSPTPLDFVV